MQGTELWNNWHLILCQNWSRVKETVDTLSVYAPFCLLSFRSQHWAEVLILATSVFGLRPFRKLIKRKTTIGKRYSFYGEICILKISKALNEKNSSVWTWRYFFHSCRKKMEALRAAVFERQGNNCSKVPKYIITSLHPHSTNELKWNE